MLQTLYKLLDNSEHIKRAVLVLQQEVSVPQSWRSSLPVPVFPLPSVPHKLQLKVRQAAAWRHEAELAEGIS